MSKRVSLSDELTTLFEGVRGARGLVEKIRQNQCSDDREHAETANAVVAFLVLLTERLRLLDRVVRGTVDGAVLSCPQNEAITREGSEVREGEEDVILRAWSGEETPATSPRRMEASQAATRTREGRKGWGAVSLRREVGGLVLWGGLIYLIVRGCLVLRPARTIAVVSTLLMRSSIRAEEAAEHVSDDSGTPHTSSSVRPMRISRWCTYPSYLFTITGITVLVSHLSHSFEESSEVYGLRKVGDDGTVSQRLGLLLATGGDHHGDLDESRW